MILNELAELAVAEPAPPKADPAPRPARRPLIRQYDLVERVRAYDADADEDLLNGAYVFAMKAHGAQLRASGDPYFHHPVEVAGILARTRSVTAAGVVSGTIVGLQGADEAGRLQCARISASALAVLGARPGLGRLWTASEEAGANAPPRSASGWRSALGADT